MAASHPVGVIAHKKSDGSDAAGDDAAAALSAFVQHRGMRRQAAPSDRSSQAEIVQGRRIVVGNAPLENFAFPGIGGRFVALQLAQDFQHSAFSEGQRSGSNVLPARQPAHELRRRHRFDLLAEFSDREAVNSGKQSSLAPLDVVRANVR